MFSLLKIKHKIKLSNLITAQPQISQITEKCIIRSAWNQLLNDREYYTKITTGSVKIMIFFILIYKGAIKAPHQPRSRSQKKQKPLPTKTILPKNWINVFHAIIFVIWFDFMIWFCCSTGCYRMLIFTIFEVVTYWFYWLAILKNVVQ